MLAANKGETHPMTVGVCVCVYVCVCVCVCVCLCACVCWRQIRARLIP